MRERLGFGRWDEVEKWKVESGSGSGETKLPAYGNGKYYRHLHVVGRYMLSVELALALFSLFT